MGEHAQHKLAEPTCFDSTIATFKQVFNEKPFLVPPQYTCHNRVRLHWLQSAFEAHVDTPVCTSKSYLTPEAELDQVSVYMMRATSERSAPTCGVALWAAGSRQLERPFAHQQLLCTVNGSSAVGTHSGRSR